MFSCSEIKETLSDFIAIGPRICKDSASIVYSECTNSFKNLFTERGYIQGLPQGCLLTALFVGGGYALGYGLGYALGSGIDVLAGSHLSPGISSVASTALGIAGGIISETYCIALNSVADQNLWVGLASEKLARASIGLVVVEKVSSFLPMGLFAKLLLGSMTFLPEQRKFVRRIYEKIKPRYVDLLQQRARQSAVKKLQRTLQSAIKNLPTDVCRHVLMPYLINQTE